MRPFAYQRATDASAAVAALAAAATDNNALTESKIQPLAGGTTLIDLMKLDVMRPSTVIDINPLASAWSAIACRRRGSHGSPADSWIDSLKQGRGPDEAGVKKLLVR